MLACNILLNYMSICIFESVSEESECISLNYMCIWPNTNVLILNYPVNKRLYWFTTYHWVASVSSTNILS